MSKLRPELVNTIDNEKLYLKFSALRNHKVCVKITLLPEWISETKEKNPSNQTLHNLFWFSYTLQSNAIYNMVMHYLEISSLIQSSGIKIEVQIGGKLVTYTDMRKLF